MAPKPAIASGADSTGFGVRDTCCAWFACCRNPDATDGSNEDPLPPSPVSYSDWLRDCLDLMRREPEFELMNDHHQVRLMPLPTSVTVINTRTTHRPGVAKR